MEKIPCTVGILTHNSAATLERALRSVERIDDVVICDGRSSDATREIARRFGARIIEQDPKYQNEAGALIDFSGVRNQCVDAAAHEWFFYIDADEEATPELIDEIAQIVVEREPRHLVYALSPRIVLDGRLILHSSNYPGWQKRFFNKRSGARFRKTVHERIDFDAAKFPLGYLRGHWHYFVSARYDAVKTEKYLRMDALHYRPYSFARLIELCAKKVITILKLMAKSGIHSLLHPQTSMPFGLEMRRVRYEFRLMGYLYRAWRGRLA